MSETILKVLFGGFIGVIGKIIYDKIRENSERKRLIALITVEMHSNLKNANNLLSDIKTIKTSPVKHHLQTYTMEEVANLIGKTCKREILNKCVEKLPYLGKEKMRHVFDFYNAFEDESNFIREYHRFGGNISVHMNENVVGRLISRCEKGLTSFEKTK